MPAKYNGVRESRPNRFNDIGGEGHAIAEDFEKKCLKRADRSFSQGLQCQEMNGMQCVVSMEDAVLIAHAPQGCTGCIQMIADGYKVGQMHRQVEHIRNARIFLTNLDQNSVVFGGEKKLKETVQKAVDRYNPKIVFIFSSCASGIIGDDIDAISEDLAIDFPDQIFVPIHCEGFKSKICASGFDATFQAIDKYILKGQKVEKQDNLVNLFAPTTISYKDQREMERMLGLLGLEVNYVPFYSNLEKIRKIPAAAASTAICKVFADEFMLQLEEDYGIPFSHTVMPIGLRNTDKWFLGIAKLVGKEKEAQEIVDAEHKRIEPLVEEIRGRLQGKRIFVCGGTGRSFAAAALVTDFGMELAGIQSPTYDDDVHEDIEWLNSLQKEYIVDISNMLPFEQANLLKRLKPDCFIGIPTTAHKLGIPTTHVLDGKRPTLGYDGLIYLGNKLADQLTNPGFNRNLAKHVKPPYRDSWYEEDPFKYIITQ